LKAAMLDRMLKIHPEIKFVRTQNADTNAAMLRINNELGFKPYMSSILWQMEIDQVLDYLNHKNRGGFMSETEKITINMSAVDLGKVDLLVNEGVYSNRTDFIRTAIRSQLEKHTFEIQQSVTRHSSVIGVLSYSRVDLEKRKQKGKKMSFSVIGMLILQNDIPAELAAEVVEEVKVRGIFNASPEVKAALADRMK
jgi:Arc/MetJ-type ribon-helix-helix transcriptional regulator